MEVEPLKTERQSPPVMNYAAAAMNRNSRRIAVGVTGLIVGGVLVSLAGFLALVFAREGDRTYQRSAMARRSAASSWVLTPAEVRLVTQMLPSKFFNAQQVEGLRQVLVAPTQRVVDPALVDGTTVNGLAVAATPTPFGGVDCTFWFDAAQCTVSLDASGRLMQTETVSRASGERSRLVYTAGIPGRARVSRYLRSSTPVVIAAVLTATVTCAASALLGVLLVAAAARLLIKHERAWAWLAAYSRMQLIVGAAQMASTAWLFYSSSPVTMPVLDPKMVLVAGPGLIGCCWACVLVALLPKDHAAGKPAG